MDLIPYDENRLLKTFSVKAKITIGGITRNCLTEVKAESPRDAIERVNSRPNYSDAKEPIEVSIDGGFSQIDEN